MFSALTQPPKIVTCIGGHAGPAEHLVPPLMIFLLINQYNINTLQQNMMCSCQNMRVSINGGTSKSSTLIGFSLINHPFWGTPIYGNPQVHTWLFPMKQPQEIPQEITKTWLVKSPCYQHINLLWWNLCFWRLKKPSFRSCHIKSKIPVLHGKKRGKNTPIPSHYTSWLIGFPWFPY